jgi:hypothetical protein
MVRSILTTIAIHHKSGSKRCMGALDLPISVDSGCFLFVSGHEPPADHFIDLLLETGRSSIFE